MSRDDADTESVNAAAFHPRAAGRGARLLLAHVASLEEPGKPLGSGRTRLEALVGDELAKLLLSALVGDHRMRSH